VVSLNLAHPVYYDVLLRPPEAPLPSSSIVVIYDLGLGTVYDWLMNMHDASTRVNARRRAVRKHVVSA